MVVARGRDREPEQILIVVDRLNDRAQEEEELRVFVRRFARRHEIDARVGRNRPVVVLAGTVDARERLFMKEAHKSVARRDLLHDFHHELVLIGRYVRRGVDRRDFMLSGRDFVVFGLCENSELPELFVEIFHVRGDGRFNDPEIVIFELLAFGRFRAEEGAPGIAQVGPFVERFFRNEEVFLFRADGRAHRFGRRIAEEAQNAQRLLIERGHGAEQGRFLIERFAAVRAERGRNTERFPFNERVRSRVPRGVAARFERGPNTAAWERRRVRLALNELFAGEFHNDAAVRGGRNKAVVLFRRNAREGLEPVRIVRRAAGDRPILHGVGDRVGDAYVERNPFVHCLFE